MSNKWGQGGAALPIVLHYLGLTKLAKEILVMGDDDQLEVRMILPLVDDASQK